MNLSPEKRLFRQGKGTGWLLIIVAALTLEATALIQFYFSRIGMREEASLRADTELETTNARIVDILNQAEASVRNSIWITEWCLDNPDSLQSVSRRIVVDNPVVMGSTVALVPGFDEDLPLFAPYVYVEKEGGEVKYRSLATEEYNYPEQEWFIKPLKSNKGYWSEPYIDEGGGDILMTTFSMPVHDKEGNTAAILTADISLDWLTGLIGDIEIYPHAFSMMISRTGKVMVCPVKDFEMNRQVWEITPELNDPVGAESVVEAMLNGEKGNRVLGYRKGKFHVYYEPVERTGWSMCIVIPQAEIFGKLRRIFWLVTLMQLVGLLMLGLIMRAAARSQKKYFALSENKEKMENELRIASEIQKSMIPKTFPPFPERKDIDMAAAIIPAKEVGGDLYDFYIRDEKLFFCIGDVSGKGVPASLVMAVTRSLFRAVSSHVSSPARIVSMMNDSMADINESNMFVTFFCGVMELANGRLRYCNAGHNAPVVLRDSKETLPVVPNLPLGIFKGTEYLEQEVKLEYDDALFLYTDGLTEAEDINHQQFGEERMMAVLSGRKTAQNHLDNISAKVREFVGEAPQSDDLTMLFIHYLNK